MRRTARGLRDSTDSAHCRHPPSRYAPPSRGRSLLPSPSLSALLTAGTCSPPARHRNPTSTGTAPQPDRSWTGTHAPGALLILRRAPAPRSAPLPPVAPRPDSAARRVASARAESSVRARMGALGRFRRPARRRGTCTWLFYFFFFQFLKLLCVTRSGTVEFDSGQGPFPIALHNCSHAWGRAVALWLKSIQ